MSESDVRINADGSCELTCFDFATLTDTVVRWAGPADLAHAWFADSRAGEAGHAFQFLWSACHEPADGIVPVLVAIAQAADDDAQRGALGAGPLEDLLPRASTDPRLLDEIERAARQEPSFRAAMQTVWMGSGVPPAVRERFAKYGAKDLT